MQQRLGPKPALRTGELGEFLAGYSAAPANSGHEPTAKEHAPTQAQRVRIAAGFPMHSGINSGKTQEAWYGDAR